MKKTFSILIGFILLSTLAAGSLYAADKVTPARKVTDKPTETSNMIITYSNGKQQIIPLDYPASAIVKTEFSKGPVSGGSDSRDYNDHQGRKVTLPNGKMSFADKVADYRIGSPAPQKKFQDPEKALGEPDYAGDEGQVTSVSLGSGGALTLEFTQVNLVDGPGADLIIFEIGERVEGMDVAVSKDGYSWVDVGGTSGGSASIDIHDYVRTGDKFSYVRLTDLGTAKKSSKTAGKSAGADIDAVAAINCVAKRVQK